ncbi:unnamed protein product [Owenia fusiformis]|uniref:Uncharacterized protein n=1 Tax=Owenia fusiformis TaxID=6347 RepID=A0A8J1XTD2_OWEFU|nr:unnamed protein product [Owenia fusiformis]
MLIFGSIMPFRMPFRIRSVVIVLVVVLVLTFMYSLAVHEFIALKKVRTNKIIDAAVKSLTADEIQEIYTKDYSVTEIKTRVQKEREEIDKLPLGIKRQRLPDVILIGIFKAGTGTTTAWLSRHPQIHQVKNPNKGFCAISYRYAEYVTNFPNISNDKKIFERTMCYSNQIVRERMAAAYQQRNVKFLIVIRDPIDRLISGYVQRVLEKDKNEPFDEHICSSNGTIQMDNDCNNSIERSVYVNELAKWLLVFPRESIHLVDGDNFAKTPWVELQKIERLLKLDHFFSEDRFPINPENPKFRCFIKYNETEPSCMGLKKGRSHPKISEETKLKLRKFFKPYNEQLFTLAGQRFSWGVNYD